MRILFIEDNKGEQVIMQEAFKEAGLKCDLDTVKDGIEAYVGKPSDFQDLIKFAQMVKIF